MPLLHRHTRRLGAIHWTRLWTPRGVHIEADDSGFVTERVSSKYWSANTHLRALDELDGTLCILALGDPGLGKSWELGDYAKRVSDRIAADVVAFGAEAERDILLAFDATEFESLDLLQTKVFGELQGSWKSGRSSAYVVIDSLDEATVNMDGLCHALLDGLDGIPLDRIRLRIACRTAVLPRLLSEGLQRRFDPRVTASDQLDGENDALVASENEVASEHREVTGEESDESLDPDGIIPKRREAPSSRPRYLEIEIAPLSRSDARAAALARLGSDLDAERFLGAISDADAESFASRPQTLFALISRFAQGQSLTGSQEDLFRSLCTTLADPSPVQPHAIHGSPRRTSRAERYQLASRICAAMLLSNRSTLSLEQQPVERGGTLDLTSITGAERTENIVLRVTESELWEAVNTALFTASSDRYGLAAHLTFAEFMTADWLTRRIEPLPQVVALLTDPNDVERRIVPQLRQVAAWLSAMRQDVFDAIAMAEPDIILWSDVVQLPPSRRPQLVEALLRGTTDNVILNPPLGFRDRLGRLDHPQLAEQLTPVLQDKSLPERTRELAIDIALANQVPALADPAVAVALDQSETTALRAWAARLIAEVGASSHRKALIGVASSPPETDVADELKGSTLRACWKLLEPHELFQILTRPKRPNWGGAYSLALSEIAEEIDASHTVAGAQWLGEYHAGSSTALDHIVERVLKLAVKAIDLPEVLSGLSAYAIQKYRRHEPLFDRIHLSDTDNGIASEVARDSSVRRRWTAGIIDHYPTSLGGLYQLIDGTPPLFAREDIPWAIKQLGALSLADPRRKCWAEVIKWSFDYQPENIAAVVEARLDPTIVDLFPDLAIHEDVDGALRAVTEMRKKFSRESARREKRRAVAQEKRKKAEQPISEGSLAARVSSRLSGITDVKKLWIQATVEILRIDAKQWAFSLDAKRLAELRSLKSWPERNTLADAAESYLDAAVVSKDPFPNGRIKYEVIFGFMAAAVLLELAPERLGRLRTSVWEKWMRAFVGHIVTNTEEPLQAEILKRATAEAEPAARREFIRLFDADAKNRRGWIRDSLLDIGLQVPGVEKEIAKRIGRGLYGPESTESLLDQLLKRGSRPAQNAAVELIRRAPTTETADAAGNLRLAGMTAMFYRAPSEVWDDLFSHLADGDETARQFFTFAARNRDFIEKAALESLTAEQIADLYVLLARLYPPETDPWHTGVFSPGPRDNIQHIRSSLLSALDARKTTAAVSALERIARGEPIRDYLVQLWLRARASLLNDRWSGIEPQEIMRLAERTDLRIVESSGQLLDVISESLVRLQDELQGEWRSVVGLWNESKGGSTPKSEEHLSNEVARHLKRDLAAKGVAIGRELQVQILVPGGAPGLRTDIDVQAPAIAASERKMEVPRVIVEVKGSWNAGLSQAMRTQLVETYLDPHKVRGGIYLVGYFTCESWKKGHQRRQSASCGTLREVQVALSGQAAQLTNALREVRAVVLDVRLPEGRLKETTTKPPSSARKRNSDPVKRNRPASRRDH